jgi:hypothetical protein
MDNLVIAPTKSSPAILFDGATGILDISGESYPENSYDFYKPVLQWLSRFCNSFAGEIVFNCRMSYLNTGSTKSMMDILDLFEERHGKGRKVSVNWFCDSDNDRAIETAEEFKEDVTFSFEIKPVDE